MTELQSKSDVTRLWPTLPSTAATIQSKEQAEVAQLVEQLIRNQQVIGSSPIFGSSFVPFKVESKWNGFRVSEAIVICIGKCAARAG